MKKMKRFLAAVLSILILAGTPAFGAASDGSVHYSNALLMPMLADVPGDEGDPDVDTVTITFVVGDDAWQEEIDKGTLLRRPQDPAQGDETGHFVGWFLDGGEHPYDFLLPVKKDIILTARFDEQYVVEFLDVKGMVAHTEWVDEGEPVSPHATDGLGIGVDKQFIYWYDAETNGDVGFDFDQGITQNMRMMPKLEDTLLVVFVSEGSQVPPQTIDVNKPVTAPNASDMKRPGYTFKHWSKEPGGAEPYPFTALETESFMLYAVWEEAMVDYTIVYWKEAPGIDTEPILPDEYIYAFSNVVTAGVKVGEEIVIDKNKANASIKNTADKNYFGAHFEYVTSETGVMANGDGSSVVNVYYKRIYHELTFNFRDKNGYLGMKSYTVLSEPGTHTAETFTMRAKLEQSIYTLWPKTIEVESAPFSLWQDWYSYDRQPYDVFSLALYQKTIVDFKGRMQASYKKYGDYVIRMYFLEMETPPEDNKVVPGKYEKYGTKFYEYAPAYTTEYQQTDTVKGYKGWPGTGSVPGFLQANPKQNGDHMAPPIAIKDANGVQKQNDFGQWMYELHYYMDRKTYTLSLNASGGLVDGMSQLDRTGIGYQTKLPEDMLEKVPEKANATFAGWYYDQGFTEPVNPDDLMPGENKILYAKYTDSGVNVYFYESEGDETPLEVMATAPGGLVKYPSVNYVEGQMYPGKGVFKGWSFYVNGVRAKFVTSIPITEDNMKVYGQWEGTPYVVRYHAEGLNSDVIVSLDILAAAGADTIAANRLYPPGAPEVQGSIFLGWYTEPDGAGTRFTAATPVTDDVDVYPYYAPPMTLTAGDVYANTNPDLAVGGVLSWRDLSKDAVLAAADPQVDTGHSSITATASVSLGRKESYPPKVTGGYPLLVTARDNYGRTLSDEVKITLYVKDTTNPTFTGLKQVAFRRGSELTAADIFEAAQIGMTDDYADDDHLEKMLQNDFKSAITNTLGTHTVTFTTQDTVGNQGDYAVSVLIWDEQVTAEPIEITIAQAKAYKAATYRTEMTPSGRYFDGSNEAGVDAPITGVNIDAVKPIPGDYAVEFSTARGTKGQATVTVLPDGSVTTTVTNGTSTPSGKQVIPRYESQKVTYSPNTGYTLLSVLVDGKNVTSANPASVQFDNVTGDHTVVVTYEPDYYKLNVLHIDSETTLTLETGAQIDVRYGETVQVDAITIPGYGADQTHVEVKITQDEMTAKLYYTRLRYKIIPSVENGEITPDAEQTVQHGGEQSFAYSPNTGYTLKSVKVDGNEKKTGNETSFKFEDVEADHKIDVVYEPDYYKLHVEHIDREDDHVMGRETLNVRYLQEMDILASSFKGYAPEKDAESVTITQDAMTVKLYYQPLKYTVAPTVVGGTITPDADTVVRYGESLTVRYTPDTGYQLKSVLVDGKEMSRWNESSYQFSNIREDHAIDVVFEPTPYRLTVRHWLQGTTTNVRASSSETYAFGEAYVASADYTLGQYTPVQAFVSGVMPNHDEEVILYYRRVNVPMEPEPEATAEPTAEPTPAPTSTARPSATPRPSATAPATALPVVTPTLEPPLPEPIEAYDPERPPVPVVEARERKRPASFIIYDDDIPLSGAASRSMGDSEE